jgi:hypothetical protein
MSDDDVIKDLTESVKKNSERYAKIIQEAEKSVPSMFKPPKEGEGKTAPPDAVIKKAKRNLGFALEELQETWADLARDKNTYAEYLKNKKNILNNLRATVIELYAQSYSILDAIGFPEKEAEKIAKEAASSYKSSMMIIFESMFPSSGKEVKRVY